MPKTWTPRALLELLLAVLGLSKAHVLARLQTQLRAQVGPAAAGRIQQLGGAALTLWQQGPAGLWHELTTHTGALLPQALGAVQGRLTQLLATGVARLLVKLALPGGALVQVLQSGYDAYETLVARARELAQVGRTLFALAGSLVQGAVAPAAQALEAVLARLLPVALDFLARTFGLDQLPRLLRLGLEALRRPINKGIDWVLGHIVQLAKNAGKGVKKDGAAAAQAGQQAVGAVKGFFGVRTKVDGGPDERTPAQKQANLDAGVDAGTNLLRDGQLTDEDLALRLTALQQQYQLTSLTLVLDSATHDTQTRHLNGTVNPSRKGPAVTSPIGTTVAGIQVGQWVEVQRDGQWVGYHVQISEKPTKAQPTYGAKPVPGAAAPPRLAKSDFNQTWRKAQSKAQSTPLELKDKQKVSVQQRGEWPQSGEYYTLARTTGELWQRTFHVESSTQNPATLALLESDFGKTWRRYNPYKAGDAWEAIRKLNRWVLMPV